MQSAAGFSAAYIPNNCLFRRRVCIRAIHDVDEDEGKNKTNDIAKDRTNKAAHITGRIHVAGEAENTTRRHNERAGIEDSRDNSANCTRNHGSDDDLLVLQNYAVQGRFCNSAQARNGTAESKALFARILRAESKRQASADDTHATAKKSKDRVGTDGHNIVDGDHNEGPMESKRNHDEAKYRSKNNAAKNGAELIDRQYGSRKQGARLLDNRPTTRSEMGAAIATVRNGTSANAKASGRTARSHL